MAAAEVILEPGDNAPRVDAPASGPDINRAG